MRMSSAREALAAIAFLASASPLIAANFATLHAFCPQTGCADGNYPTSALVADPAGDLFGTTALGGDAGWGTIFEFIADGKGGYKFRRLHSFCKKANCTDGSDPIAGLVIDTAGNLYGTTKFGGTQNGGTAFELIRSGRKSRLKILHSFCAQGASCADGSLPVYDGLTYQGAASGTPYDGASPLYGTTMYGGENNAGFSGTVYQLEPTATKRWKEKVIYQFCAVTTSCTDGSRPEDGLAVDAKGNLFGVTYAGGGSNDDGVIFELSHGKGGWSETVLHDFCSEANCADGSNPESPLALDASGNLFGSATSGGTANWGVVFEFVPGSAVYSVLYDFCSLSSCSDGTNPAGRLAVDASGDIFGTTISGGAPNFGVLYELSAGALDVLYTFCTAGNCTDGQWPVGGIVLGPSQTVFGTTSEGGEFSSGTVFAWTP